MRKTSFPAIEHRLKRAEETNYEIRETREKNTPEIADFKNQKCCPLS